jgi:hypothetical protein
MITLIVYHLFMGGGEGGLDNEIIVCCIFEGN